MEKTLQSKDAAGRSWMAVYTRSKCEKKVHQLLSLKGIKSFCPLVKIRKKWADRVKLVEMPLFTSYVFVCIDEREQLQVLQTAGIVNFVYYCGKPAVVPVADIEKIRDFANRYEDLETVSVRSLCPGDQVTINDGALFDCRGEVLEIQGKTVLVIIKQLDCALIAKVKVNLKHLLLSHAANGNHLIAT